MAGIKLISSLIQGLWMGACLKETLAFKRAAKSPVYNVQANVLGEIVTATRNTRFGKHYGFDSIRSIADFSSAVPVNDYDDLLPWINEIADGAPQVLTADPVIMFEETSGTTSGTRLIPYTAGLQRAFNRALHPWLFDLHMKIPGLWGGPAYWVVTPRGEKKRFTAGGIPIGFAADSDYFGKWAKPLIKAVTVVPEEASTIASNEEWRYFTVLQLLRHENLRLISLWNPTFFSALINSIVEWVEPLAVDLEQGSCGALWKKSRVGNDSLSCSASPLVNRSLQLKAAVRALQQGKLQEFTRILWPELALISTWTEAEAAFGALHLREYFPDVLMQPKGLLATEGAVTLPMFGAPASVLAARSAFFEFEEGEEGNGAIRLADELEEGCRYRVIMTTFAGLFRYRLHDVVEMKGWWGNLPCLAFCGKEAMVSDLCGEKLNAAHVKAIIAHLAGHNSAAFMAPEKPALPELPGYMLFLPAEAANKDLQVMGEMLESALCENFHYRWCRDARQLSAAQIQVLPVRSADLQRLCLQRHAEEGRSISTAKLSHLNRLSGWKNWFSQHI